MPVLPLSANSGLKVRLGICAGWLGVCGNVARHERKHSWERMRSAARKSGESRSRARVHVMCGVWKRQQINGPVLTKTPTHLSFSHPTHVAVPTLLASLSTRNMRTLHPFVPPFLPSPTDPFSLQPHMPSQVSDSDQQALQNSQDNSVSPQQQNLPVIVTIYASPRSITL